MPETMLRLSILLAVFVLVLAVVWVGRYFVAWRRLQVLSADPMASADEVSADMSGGSCVRILAFRSEDCQQCHRLQSPALRRLLEMHEDSVSVVDIDASGSPELTRRYQVLTIPTTVLLDAKGKARAINYGFANAHTLLKQVDEILSQDAEAS